MRYLDRAKRIALSTPLLGAAIALLTWPLSNVAPLPGLDPSWLAGLYMGTERGLDAGTQIIFSYGPLGFLGIPSLFEIDLGRLAFVWFALVHAGYCIGLLWGSRRAFGLIAGVAITIFAAATPFTDPVLILAAVVAAAALLDEWSLRLRTAFAVGAGALTAIQLLGSLRAGPTLLVMAIATIAALPDRRRSFAAFFGSLALVFAALWFATGQGLGNFDDYVVNTGNVVSGYSSAMVFLEPSRWWELPAGVLGVATVIALCVAALWRLDNPRRIGLAVMVAAVTFLMFKHAVVRSSAGSIGVFLAALLAISLALVPHVRRSIAIVAVAVLIGLVYVGNKDSLEGRLELQARAELFVEQAKTMALPGRAAKEQLRGREAMGAFYALTPHEVGLLGSKTVHIAGWEAGVAWAYELNWDPLPIFQQYTAYTERLDDLNAEKLESATAPERILWENGPAVDPAFAAVVSFPGAIDARWPAWDSPAQMVEMFCRYRAEQWDERWAILRRGPDRCQPERHLETDVVANGKTVRLPGTRPNEALIVRVTGLETSGIERLRAFLFRAVNRSAVLDGNAWNVIGATAKDGLLLRVPRWADYPGKFALNGANSTVSFERWGGFLTGVDSSTKLTLSFSALPLDAPAVLPVAAQKRRVQR